MQSKELFDEFVNPYLLWSCIFDPVSFRSSFSSSDAPAIMTDDGSVSMSILLQSFVIDTLLDWTMDISFDAIDMDTELEKCKHLRNDIRHKQKLCQETQMNAWNCTTPIAIVRSFIDDEMIFWVFLNKKAGKRWWTSKRRRKAKLLIFQKKKHKLSWSMKRYTAK